MRWPRAEVPELTIVDDYTRECPAIEVDHALSGERVVRVLERLAQSHGLSQGMVCDNGPEFTSEVLDVWASRRGLTLHFIAPGQAMQNAYAESFDRRLRDECLNETWFVSCSTPAPPSKPGGTTTTGCDPIVASPIALHTNSCRP
jgi:transposase InsO family protein